MFKSLIAPATLVVLLFVVTGCQTSARNLGDPIEHYVDGRVLADQGENQQALEELDKAIQADPELSVAYVASGNIHFRQGDFSLARTSYENAVSTNPYSFEAHYKLGATYEKLAEFTDSAGKVTDLLKEAIDVYLRSVELEPEDFDAQINISACYFQLGKYNLAEQYCKNAIRIQPRNPNAYNNLGIIYDSQNKLYEAVRTYKKSLEIEEDQPKLLLNLGSTYMRQKRYKSAIRAFKLAAEYAPEDTAPLVQIATAYYRTGEYAKAIDRYKQAIEMDPESHTALRGLGVVYMTQYLKDREQTGLRDKALELWHQSLEIHPNQADLRTLVEKYSPQTASPEL